MFTAYYIVFFILYISQLESNLLINYKCTLLQETEREGESVSRNLCENVIVPNKLAELVKLLALPTPLSHTHMHTDSPHSSLCTHLIHNWHGSSLRPGEQCKAKQRNDSNKVGPHFGTNFFFLFNFTLYALILLVSSSDAILLYLYFFKFIVVFFVVVYFRKLFAARALDFLPA